MTAPRHHRQGLMRDSTPATRCLALVICAAMMIPTFPQAQTEDPTGVKRAFLDRYLDCAEAPEAATRLDCYDALLVDIPAWLEEPAVPDAAPDPVPAPDPAAETARQRAPCAD